MDATSGAAAMRQFERRVFKRGDTIFRQGAPGDCAFLVQGGSVEIVKGGKILGTIEAGGMFGEMALIDGEPRMAMARAAEDTACLLIPEEVFRLKLSQADPFIVGLLRILLTTIRSTSERIVRDDRAS